MVRLSGWRTAIVLVGGIECLLAGEIGAQTIGMRKAKPAPTEPRAVAKVTGNSAPNSLFDGPEDRAPGVFMAP